MKLLFDNNLSHKLVSSLKDIFPDSTHVRIFGSIRDSDEKIWKYAKENNYTIVSQDDDFNHLSGLYGSPPKLIWLKLGNTTTIKIEKLLRVNFLSIKSFIENPKEDCLIIQKLEGYNYERK